jgi:hypothetical protein
MVFPTGYRQRLRELAPDLWSIRDYSLDLDEAISAPTTVGTGHALELTHRIGEAGAPSAAPRPSWRSGGDSSDEACRASGIPFSLAGVPSMRAWPWGAQRWALRSRTRVLGVARRLRERLGDTPETVRDLSISLDKVGGSARALGRSEEAGPSTGRA